MPGKFRVGELFPGKCRAGRFSPKIARWQIILGEFRAGRSSPENTDARWTMGRMFVLCHCVFTVIADIEMRNSGVIPLHEAPWTGCLGV